MLHEIFLVTGIITIFLIRILTGYVLAFAFLGGITLFEGIAGAVVIGLDVVGARRLLVFRMDHREEVLILRRLLGGARVLGLGSALRADLPVHVFLVRRDSLVDKLSE